MRPIANVNPFRLTGRSLLASVVAVIIACSCSNPSAVGQEKKKSVKPSRAAVKPASVTGRRPARPLPTRPVPGRPWLAWDSVVWDYGSKVLDGKPMVGRFTFRNTGEADLQLTGIKPDIGCTAVEFDKVVPPGGTGKVVVSINTKFVGGQGKSTRNITVWSNSPGHPRTELHATGEILLPLEIKPTPYARFDSVDQLRESTVTLEIVSHTPKPGKIVKVTSDNPRFKADVEPDDEGRGYRLNVTAVPPFQHGTTEGKITLTTDLIVQPTIVVTALARHTARVFFVPNVMKIRLGLDVERTSTVKLINRGTTPVHIVKATVTEPGLTTLVVRSRATANSRQRRASQSVEVTIPANHKSLSDDAVLIIETDDKEFSKITVPIQSRKRGLSDRLRKRMEALGITPNKPLVNASTSKPATQPEKSKPIPPAKRNATPSNP